jgi:hypothetical protein
MTTRSILLKALLISCIVFGAAFSLRAKNDILGEVRFVGWSKVERTSGVWIDGQYVGYLGELNGSKKVLLLPGKHEVVIQQGGYRDFKRSIVLNPGEQYHLAVSMERDPQAEYPNQTATVKFQVKPNRAAVFMDGMFVGHVDEFDGPRQAMLVAPGEHQFEITLPGYKPFRTEVSLLPDQKFEIKTNLFPGSILESSNRLTNRDRAEAK